MDDNIKKLHQALIDDGYDDVGTEQEFRDYVSDSKNVATLYNALSEAGYDNFKDQKSLETYLSAKAPVAQKPSTPQSSGQSVYSKEKKQTQYPQEVIDAFNSPDNKPGNFKDLAQLNDEYQRGELKKPGIISQALGMFSNVDAGNVGKEQKVGGMIANMLLGDNMQQPHDNNQQVQHLNQDNVPATEQTKPTVKDVDAITSAAPVQQVDAIYNKYVGKGDALSETMYDLMASGQAKNQEEAQNMAMGAMNRAASRLAQRTTDEFVSKLGDTVEGVDEAVMNGWHSHAVQDNLKKLASQYGIMNNVVVDENGQYITQTNGYDQFINGMVKPAMVESLVKKYGENYRKTAEDLATRLYSNDEVIQNQLMNQDINDALSSVISKYVNPSVVDEYNKAQEAGSKAFTEGMEGSQFIPANLRLGTALGAQYEANEAKDPAKVLSSLQKKFGKLYRNPKFLNDMSNAAFKVMQRYGLNGTQSSDPKQFKPMINSVLKNELDQLEIKGMMPKGSAEYIMKTGLGNTIVGKITRKAVQTDYQNWLEDIANQQYQPGFWENVASGALTFAGDAWSYWLPGAAGGKLTKSMIAKAEGKLAGDLMAKGMERKVAERAAKVLIGKSKAEALRSGAAHGAVTFGGQSAISKPIDEIYRTGQFDENGKIYNPSVGMVIANTLGEVAKQSAVGAIMQGGTIANMVGKGRGLATNILADIGGKVADSGIMTGHQMLERMAQDPNFKPTGKDAAESFLESMANLTAIGLPGMVGKYARFKDAREFNKKFDFTDQDIAELKRFGYDGLRDAFEKMGIGEYAVVGENAQRLDGQLTQKYMDLMNDKSVPEVLKAKMMAVVEGKRPSSFSPVIDSEVYRGDDGKYYLETYNKDGGVIDRKEYSSLDEAQKADKKLEYEKTLGLASVLEGEFHNEFTQEHLEGLYNKAAQKYNMGEKLTDEDKAAVYLHQNAGAIKEIMDKQQKGIILTDEEQKQVNAYRHYYDSALENSSVMREFVNTFEDSHDVAHGTLRKALESKDKKYAPLVESYLKELYNSIELKREMKQIEDDKKRIEQGDVDGAKPATPVEESASVEGSAVGQEPPVSEEPAPYQDRTNSVPTPSDAEVAANPANSAAEGAGNEPKVASSDAFVMGQNAYKNGDSDALQAIGYNSDLATGRLKRAFADNEKMPDIVANAYNEGRDMEQFVAQRASLTPAQKDAISKYVEAMDAKKGAIDALQHADDGYGDALKEQLWPYQTEDGNIVPATLDSGKQVFLKKANEYGGAFVVVPDEQGLPTVKQVSNAEIKEVGTPVSLDEYIENTVAQQKDARAQQFISQFDGSGLKRGDIVSVSMEEGDEPSDVKIVGYTDDGHVILTDTDIDVNAQIDPKKLESVTKDKFNAWRQNALNVSIGAELDAEDAQRANDDATKAEADKKQRYANGIVGLGEGQPDYSSNDTDPNVAAEYLQEQFREDHGKLLNLVNGSRDDIKTQLANKRKAAIEYQNWLDTNADLDPEKAKKVEDELSLVNEQIADLDARFKNWNTIRNSVMTPDEVKAMKEERKAEVEKAGVDESAIVPSDDFHVLVLEDEELKKQYPTMDKATDYITSQRKDLYHTQEDVERKINGVNDMLDQYINGETELDPSQLMELNTTKAQLEALQTNLSVAAKGLKAQANKLSRLYKTEVSQQEMEDLGMTPSEQRKALVTDALKKNDMKAIHEIYKDASVDVMDLTPQTLEEAVSESLFPHSLNPESLQYELGKSNFKFGIGKRYDSNKFNYLIAKKGTGMSVNEFAVRVYNDLPVNLQDMGYTDQDVRNALLDMFKSYDSVKEMRNVALMNRIAAAEDELSSEEEYYEAQKEREIFERQAENPDYYAYLEDNSVPLPTENELNQIAGMIYDRMMEIEDREREYKQYVKSILPELADYDDRSNEEGYGGGSSLGSDSSRRGVDERNRNSQEGGSREASAEAETGALHNSTGEGRQEVSGLASGEGSADRTSHLSQVSSFGERLKSAIAETETEPTEAQKKAGNYKKGHLSFGGYDYTVETPKGVTRSGKDEQGKPWSVTMHDTYGYILGKIGVDGDHIDMFINDAADLDTFDGNVYVVDQVNPETGEFDEHKVMYGYPSEEAATEAYLANYSKGWKGLGKVTSVAKSTFDKWLESSDRKTKPFAEYAMVQKEQAKTNSDFIAQMEYDYENDIHPSEEDKPKMQKFVERLLNFHSDKEDKIDSGYTILSSNIQGDKLYPNEKKWFGTGKYRKGVSWVDKQNSCAYEVNPRFNKRGYLSAVGVHKIVPLMKFDRDVKEVKPAEMTEAQKVAYDAVSTMLKKAGIPVKVVSNEDMEKVAEAQDNMAVEMLLNDPRLRFYIKTPEQKEAAKAAYDWAAGNRPDKFKQYAIVNMDNPNQPPQYFEKKDLAEKWRKYYTNAWMIGNYKAFNLNKPFEDQIKDVKGDVPSEFDPYKAESLLNKRIELEKQIKETEDSYNAKKKERAEYQNQLMQDYMDQHGLSSENDIPDDVWTDYRDKSFEKYQDTLDDLFHKYVELDNQLKAVAEPGVQYLKGKGVVYGYTDGKQIVLNQEHLNPNTPIHEYQHLWRTAAKNMNPELIEHGDKLIMQTQLFADLKKDPNYNYLTDEQICDEAFARLTGEDGAAILEQMAKDAIKENPLDTAKELSVINKLKEWLKKFWYWTLDTFTKWKPEDIKKMTLEDIRNLVLRDLANGVDPRTKLHEAENADDIKFMGSTTKKRMKDISTQLEGRELDEAQQAVADVYSGKKDNVSLTVEREDGSNKIIMRQGNDNHAGTKHSVFRHYGVKANSLNVDDLLLIPTVLKEGERKVSDNGRVAYVYVDPTSQVKYTVVTEPKNNKEFFNDFYSNKKANPSETSRVVENSTNTPEGAHNNDGNAFMRAKVDNNSETAKENGGNLSVEDKIKAVSQQFGVDEADVAMYANAIKKGSTAEAARARVNIKRHLLQANEDKISSFKELLKYTVPVNEALKENFGDVDAMIEERKQQMEAQRNAMEAARKRAEEEEAKRQKHLEELSLIPDDQLDKQYMDALAKGDDATAREMLDEAARRKGYDDTESAYQGVGAWAAPGNPGYESDKARRDDWESSGSDVNLEDIALGYTPQPDDYFSHPERYSQNTFHGLESVKAINTAIDAIKNGEKDVKVKVYRAVPTSVKEGKLRNGDWVTPSKKYAEMHGTNRLEGKYRIIEDEVPATQLWWDGNDANEFGFDDGKAYKYKNAKNNRKLNDLVTFDDEGDVIPPSKRFNSRKQDVRFHRVTEPEELDRLNKEKTFRMYSGMQEVDGKLYSPMAAIIDGKRTDATEIGAWMGADERPDLVKGGKFQLVKTDKNPGAGEGPVRAAYNPYMHTSTSMMNDQFTGAYARGNIKVVEWEIPESEKTSGYHAEGAKDAVGLVPWHSGSVNGLLPKDRQRSVMLSRWRKAVRVVPDSEVAESIAEQLEGTGLAIPWNVVTPNQVRELVKLGVPITTVESGQQAPETKEKFIAQMEELKKEFPQAQFVDVKMTKEAFNEWGGKGIVKSPILEQKLQKHPDSLMKAGTYFSGGGLVEEGLKGIIDPVVAVEYDRKISGVYRNNFGQHIVTADVRDVDPKELVKHIDGEVEYFHASPVCKNYSQAKSNSGEVELDKETAKSTADFINAVKPRVVTIENVKGYKDSEAMKIITNELDKNGYTWDSDVYNAADYGGYTSRERLIVRAVKDGELPEKPKKQPRKGGWLEAVEDILPTLTVKESGVAPWMDARLKADGIDWQKVEKPLYVMGSAYADGKIPHAYGDEILPTLRTKSGDVIIMPGGKVLRADGRVLARITGLGDDYKLPKTESLAHTIIGNGIPVQLTKGVIAPLLNKDDLSGRNVLARLGSSIFKNNWDADKQKQVSDRVVNTANKLGGAEATVYTSVDEVPDAYLSDVKNGATGWYDPTTHTVHVYLPNCADANEAERTVLHEKIGHEGMEVLLGGEDGVRKFANFVYRSVGKDVRGKIIDFANKYDPDWKNSDRMNVGTQEYIAHLAEEGPKTAEDFSLWTKIKHYLIKVLKKLGVRVPGLLNDKDLRYYLMKAGKALHVWDEMPQEKQEAMMKQASNAEIKDALSDGAGKGKPQMKKGESAIQFIKRASEWERWKEAREDENDPEPPMFYDFDKDAEGKKEWERLNKEWRDSHHLQGDEMSIEPERKEGETEEAFSSRYKEWEKWNDAMADKENPMPDMFSFEKEKQDEARQKYEDWLTKHELNEQNNADLDLYEGKIYPAETNPEADALEQRVMQDLAEVTSTDVSKEGAARSVHDAVIYRRKNIESASADDAIFINSVKQDLNKIANTSYLGRKADAIADAVKETVTGKSPKTLAKKMAEAIPYIIEAPRRMRDIADEMNAVGAFENGHIHVTANDIDAIQPFTEELRNLASKNHKVEKDGKETIVYDDVPSMAEVASKMAKAINDNHVGEEGFVPVDGTDILAEHVLPVILKRIVPKGIEYQNLSEEMQSLLDKIREWYDKTFTWLKDSHTVREDIGYTKDYVNHRWDKKKSDDKAYADLVEGRQRTKSPNEKPRKISTFMEGVDAGLVPKTTDITDLLAYYSQSNIEAFANKTFLQELSGINVIERNKDGEITSSMPLLTSIQPKEMMVDENKYTPYVVPGINTVWVYNQGKIFNKSAEDWFNAAFGTVKLPKVLKGVKNAMSIAKTLELGFSGFHAGALTEVYAVQNSAEFGPAKAMAYFMKYLITDTAKNHQLPAFANPDVFKEAAKHLVKFGSASDYATADIENLYEKVHSYVARLHSKLVEGNVAMKAGSSVTFPLEVATELLKMSQKGLDVALWSYLHDGLKLATYQLRAERTRERAKKLNWDEDMLNKALDEDGQFVNDMFGGQHFDVLGISKKMQTILDFVFLSKDWLISTTRHALSIFGYGSIWNEASIKNFMEYYKHVLGRGEMTKEDYLRLSRSKSGLLCYGIGFMIGYEGLSQLVNAAMRAWDEKKQKEKADEIRKTNPSYKSSYELAYPNGMHWYDYLMRGNSLGQQSKIFMGRYADGTEMYIRHGKQFREIPELFFDAKDNFAIPGPMVRRMYGKASPLLRGMIDTYKWYLSPDYGDKEMQRKYGENLGLIPKLASYYIPFAVPTQKDKEFKMLDLVFPSSKGFSRYKAQDYFKTFIMSEDKQGLAMTYNACVQNGIDPEVQLKAAISSVKALEASEMSDGVTSLQEASKRFDAAKSITEKKKMRQKMKKFLSQSDYKAFTQKEALDMVQGYLNGDEDLKEMEKAESKYLMKAKAEDVTEDWRIQNVWNGTMETYQEYQRLKDVDKAKANAFKNSKTNKRLFAARKAISAARRKMNKAKKQMDGTNDAAKLVEIRNTRKELLKTLNGME
jgi:site-specific DNA-cytosine methylase